MKKITILLLSVILMAVSCTREENRIIPSGENTTLSVLNGIDTKTHLEATSLAQKVLWSEGDQMKINGVEYTIIDGVNTNMGKFNVASASEYRAVYPATLSTTDWTEGTEIAVSLPATQPYNTFSSASNITDGVLPMVGFSSSDEMLLKYLCGMVQFTLPESGVGTISSIKVICDASHNISGPGSVAYATTTPVLTMDVADEATANNEITITTPEGGVAVSGSETFFVVLPQGTYNSLTFQIETVGNGTIEWTVSDLVIMAGQVRRTGFTAIPAYESYLGDWRISSWSSSSVTYKNITITDNREVEANTYLITTEEMPVNCGEGVGTLSYPFVFKASYIPADGTIEILGQKVATIPQMVYTDTYTDVDMWAVCTYGNSLYRSTTKGFTGTWTGTNGNPKIVLEGGFNDDKKITAFGFYPYQSGTSTRISAYSRQYKLQTTATDSITISRRAAIPSIDEYVGSWKLWSMKASAPFKYYDAVITKTNDSELNMKLEQMPFKGGMEETSRYDFNFTLKYQSDGSIRIASQTVAEGLSVVVNNTERDDNGTTVTDGVYRAVAYAVNLATNGVINYPANSNSVCIKGSIIGSGQSAQVYFEGNTFTSSSNTYKVTALRFFPMASDSGFSSSFKTEQLRTAIEYKLGEANGLPIHLTKN